MADKLVRLSVDGPVATVTLDRPDHDNLITHEMMEQCHSSLASANESNADILVLKAEGTHFSPGRDKSEDLSHVPREEVLSLLLDTNAQVADFEGISIAVVQGDALGFGCGLTVQSDLTVAADTARFGYNEINHGGVPKIVMSYLETYVGRKAAVDLVITGRSVSADDAQTMGLVTRVVPNEELEPYADGLIQSLLKRDLDAATECKFYFRAVESIEKDDLRDYIINAMM